MTNPSVLDRVRQFLPQLAESNAALSSSDQHELDIENIRDGDSYYIEMVHGIPVSISALAYLSQNLGLGVFEGAPPDEGSTASHSSSSSSMSETDDDDGDDSDTSSSGSSSSSEDRVQPAARPKKPLPRRAIPNITVLSESGNQPGVSPASPTYSS